MSPQLCIRHLYSFGGNILHSAILKFLQISKDSETRSARENLEDMTCSAYFTIWPLLKKLMLEKTKCGSI